MRALASMRLSTLMQVKSGLLLKPWVFKFTIFPFRRSNSTKLSQLYALNNVSIELLLISSEVIFVPWTSRKYIAGDPETSIDSNALQYALIEPNW